MASHRHPLPLRRQWQRAKLDPPLFRQDFEVGIWDVAINGHIFRANLAMERQAPSLEKIEFIGQSRLPLWIDDVQVSRNATAYQDQDRDGLPDDWEGDGLDRDADPDEDGLTNIEELVLGTKPTEADTDGDGKTDGVEYELQSNPLQADEADNVLAQVYGSGYIVQVSDSGVSNGWVDLTFASWLTPTLQWKVFCQNSENYVYITDVDSGQFINNGTMQYYGGTINAYVGSNAGGRAYFYIWAEDWSNGYSESIAFIIGTDGSTKDLTSSIAPQYRWSSSGGSQEAADDTLEAHCYSCEGEADCDGLGSVKFNVGLGSSRFGDQQLNLRVHEKTWSDRLYSRESIQFVEAPSNVEHGFSELPRSRGTLQKRRQLEVRHWLGQKRTRCSRAWRIFLTAIRSSSIPLSRLPTTRKAGSLSKPSELLIQTQMGMSRT